MMNIRRFARLGRFESIGLAAGLWMTLAGAAMATCGGDCGNDGEVSFEEVLVGIEIALGTPPTTSCSPVGSGNNGQVTVEDVVLSVDEAVAGCEAPMATPTPTATPSATPTAPACVSDGRAAIVASSAVPSSGSGPLQVNCVTVENAGGTRSDLTRVSVRGTINGIGLLLQIYFVTATGEVENVSYGWMPFDGIPDFFDNLVFCSAPACGGTAANLATKRIVLNDITLAGENSQSAVLNGSLTLDRIPAPIATPTPPCPGGSLALNFSEVQGTNSSQPLPATLALGTAMNFSRSSEPPVFAYLSALYDGCPMPFPRTTLGFQFSGAPIQAGSTYQVGSSQGQLNQIEFREEGFSSFKAWEAQSGTLIVDSTDNAKVTFRIVDAHMRTKDIGTRGTFVLNATGSLNTAP